eukprot:Hpha_TRINITY_DN16232_c3_g5::TRINITY_DN16232_c3_g5_i1::g.14426::m.14426
MSRLQLFYVTIDGKRPLEVDSSGTVGDIIEEIARMEDMRKGPDGKFDMQVSFQGKPLYDLEQAIADTGLSSECVLDYFVTLKIKIDTISSSEMTDKWQTAGNPLVLQCRPGKIVIGCKKWHDQGWGGMKGAVSLQTKTVDGELKPTYGGDHWNAPGVWGVYGAGGEREKSGEGVAAEKVIEDDWLSNLDKGSNLQVVYRVGGGGGHSIKVHDLYVEVM